MLVRRFLVATLSLLGLMSFAAPSLRAADKPDKIVVSGASGQLGKLAVKELLRRGVDPKNLILVSRTPGELTEYAKMGATVRYADMYKPETLANAYVGGTRMLFISIGPGPTPRFEAHKAGFDAAVKAGVKHIVYTSYIGADKGESPAAADHQQSENYLRASGAKWTLLRNGFYADIHVAAAIEMVKTGRTTLRSNEPKSAPVTRADCAAAAAGALLNPSLSENQAFDITGPELYSRRDVAEAVSAMTGKSIEVIEAPEPSLGPAGSHPGSGVAGSTIPIGPPPTTPPVVSDAVVKLAGRPAIGLKALLDTNKEQILAAAKGS